MVSPPVEWILLHSSSTSRTGRIRTKVPDPNPLQESPAPGGTPPRWGLMPLLLFGVLAVWLSWWNVRQGRILAEWLQQQEGRSLWHALLQAHRWTPEDLMRDPRRLTTVGTEPAQVLLVGLKQPMGWITGGPRSSPDALRALPLPEPGATRRLPDGTAVYRFQIFFRPDHVPGHDPEAVPPPSSPDSEPYRSGIPSFLDPDSPFPPGHQRAPGFPTPEGVMDGLGNAAHRTPAVRHDSRLPGPPGGGLHPARQPARQDGGGVPLPPWMARPNPGFAPRQEALRAGGRLPGPRQVPGPEILLWYRPEAGSFQWPWLFQAILWPAVWVASFITWRILARNREHLEKIREEHRRQTHLAAVGRMTARLAHEIRNPLGAVKGAAQHLQARSPEVAGPLLQLIEAETTRLETLTRGILDFSRPRTLQAVPGDVVPVIRECVRVFQTGTPDRAVTVNLPDTPVEAVFDREAVHQILLNLLKNAHEASPPEPPLTVGLAVRGRHQVVRVDDQGRGIAPEDRENLFQPFFSTKTNGYGLGLVVCRQMAEGMGGSLTLQNRVAGGCRAELSLRGGSLP